MADIAIPLMVMFLGVELMAIGIIKHLDAVQREQTAMLEWLRSVHAEFSGAA